MSNNKLRSKTFAKVALNWLTTEQGGRKRPIGSADYAATAYFTEENVQLFSIILYFPAKLEAGLRIPTRTDIAEMDFLVSELVAPQLKEGMRFHVTEGGRVVAKGEVLSVVSRKPRSESNVSRRPRSEPNKRRCRVLYTNIKTDITRKSSQVLSSNPSPTSEEKKKIIWVSPLGVRSLSDAGEGRVVILVPRNISEKL